VGGKSRTLVCFCLWTPETAQMEQELQSRVLAVTRKTSDKMEEETGIETSMTEEDMKQYLNAVLKEIRTSRSGPLDH
jgi:hypothetical protein